MIVLFWSRATRDLLKSFGWGIAALHRLHAARKLPSPRRPPHRISPSHPRGVGTCSDFSQRVGDLNVTLRSLDGCPAVGEDLRRSLYVAPPCLTPARDGL